MAAAAAALPALAAGKDMSGVIRSVVTAMEKPIYSNLETTTVTHVAQNGDVIVRTRTKGWTVPLGLPVLAVGAAAFWEIGLAFSKAFGIGKGGPAADFATADLLMVSPVLWAFDEAGNAVGNYVGTTITGEVNKFWDWLDGSGRTHSDPPPAAVKTVAMPPTGMAAINQFLQHGVGALSAPMAQVVPKILNTMLNPKT